MSGANRAGTATTALLQVRGLRTMIHTADGLFPAVDGVSFDLRRHEKLAIVGESGSGKSVTALSIIGLLPLPVARIFAGQVIFDGVDLVKASRETLRDLRGRRIGMLFQDPMTSLNPLLTIRRQLYESVEAHLGWSKNKTEQRALNLLDRVRIADPRRVLSQYPHQLSGGMRQRVMLAMALMCGPDLIIADEPTTALDVTVQEEVVTLMEELAREEGCAIIFISHDLNLVSQFADRIIVMYGGKVVESGPAFDVYTAPRHPYAADLVRSIVRIDEPRRAELMTVLGQPPSLGFMPPGCSYHPRCRLAVESCKVTVPALVPCGSGEHEAACILITKPLAG